MYFLVFFSPSEGVVILCRDKTTIYFSTNFYSGTSPQSPLKTRNRTHVATDKRVVAIPDFCHLFIILLLLCTQLNPYEQTLCYAPSIATRRKFFATRDDFKSQTHAIRFETKHENIF